MHIAAVIKLHKNKYPQKPKSIMLRKWMNAIGKFQAKTINKAVDRLNPRRKLRGKAPLMHAEPALPSSIKELFTRGFAINPNQGGKCSAYATRVAKDVFGKQYVYAPAWKLASENKLVFESKFDPQTLRGEIAPNELREMIKSEKLKPGMMLGLFYPESKHNHVQRRVTHIMVYAGDGTFWHNYGGIRKTGFLQIYYEKEEGKRVLYPVQVIDAK
jgi:hypothetical protein